MSFPELLKQDFDILNGSPNGRILPCYRVRERKPFGREFMLRLLPDSYCQDTTIVNAFHDFFTRFAQISNKTYLAQVHSVVGAVNRSVYVLEEFVSGISLTEFVEKKKDAGDFRLDAINIIARVCEALHYAHQKDIFHLCVSPDDILIDENNPGKVKLVGFGAQIFCERNRATNLPTEVNKYLAPELLNGKSFGPSADVYSLAAAIKEVVPETLNWDALISRSLSKTPSDRPSSARAFAQELKDLLVNKTRSPRSQPVANRSGGLQPLLNIKTQPDGAQVSLNGKIIGMTTPPGLRIPWKQGLAIEIAKSGFATETLTFTDPPDNSEITVKLKSAFRLFTNPWGASVLVDGKHVGVTDREGLMVPWDGATIEIQKAGYRPEILRFVSPPGEQQSYVELQPMVSSVSPKRHPLEVIGYAMGAIVLWLLPLVIYSGVSGGAGSSDDRSELIEELNYKRSQISRLKSTEIENKRLSQENLSLKAETEKLRKEYSAQNQIIATKDKEIARLNQVPHIAVKIQNPTKDRDLLNAARLSDPVIVSRLLAEGANINARDPDGLTPLMIASYQGIYPMVRELLQKGSDVNLRSHIGKTALMMAVHNGYEPVVILLLEKGASVNDKTDRNETALTFASQMGFKKIAELLRQNGAKE